MNKVFIFLFLLIFPLLLNAQKPLSCVIKGGIIDKPYDRPYLIIHYKNSSEQVFSYNNTGNEACVKSLDRLYKNDNILLKKNRQYVVSFLFTPGNKGEISAIKETLKLKVKARQKNDNTAVKAIIQCDMKEDNHLFSEFGYTKKFDYYSEYITHIESYFDTTKVLDMYTSPNLSLNPYLSFMLNKPFNPKKIRFEITNNKNFK